MTERRRDLVKRTCVAAVHAEHALLIDRAATHHAAQPPALGPSSTFTEQSGRIDGMGRHFKFSIRFLLMATVALAAVSDACARAVRILEMKKLMEGSQLVLVGKIRSVKPSGITTELTYPTWNGVVFEWLKVEVEVVEPIKGTKKGDLVKTLMLSTRGPGPFFNAPGMVSPKVGQHHLLFLLPTKFSDVFASITAPFDDDQGIFLLFRNDSEYGAAYKENPKLFDEFPAYAERYKAIWALVNDKGEITAEGAEQLRAKYKAEIATPAPKDAVIHIKWKKAESESGWQWNVPDEDDGTAVKANPSPPKVDQRSEENKNSK